MVPPRLVCLIRLIDDEVATVKFLQSKNLLPREQLCINGHQMLLSFSLDGPIWLCNDRECGTRHGVRKNTWLQNTSVPLDLMIFYIYCWSMQLDPLKYFDPGTVMLKRSIGDLNDYLRKVCQWRVEQEGIAIDGKRMSEKIDKAEFIWRKKLAGDPFETILKDISSFRYKVTFTCSYLHTVTDSCSYS